MRIHVDEENVSYETKHWDVMPDQHFVWTVTLDEQVEERGQLGRGGGG